MPAGGHCRGDRRWRLERDVEGEHARLGEAGDGAVADEHRPCTGVVDEDVRRRGGRCRPARASRAEQAEQLRPDAAALVVVADGDGDVGGGRVVTMTDRPAPRRRGRRRRRRRAARCGCRRRRRGRPARRATARGPARRTGSGGSRGRGRRTPASTTSASSGVIGRTVEPATVTGSDRAFVHATHSRAVRSFKQRTKVVTCVAPASTIGTAPSPAPSTSSATGGRRW